MRRSPSPSRQGPGAALHDGCDLKTQLNPEPPPASHALAAAAVQLEQQQAVAQYVLDFASRTRRGLALAQRARKQTECVDAAVSLRLVARAGPPTASDRAAAGEARELEGSLAALRAEIGRLCQGC